MKHWLVFVALAIVWGTSFYWQKLALREIGPFMIVSLRFLLAFVVSTGLMRLNKLAFPRDARTWLGFFVLSIFYSSLPVLLNTWASGRVDATLGSILNATSPIFALLFAVFVFGDEKLTAPKLLGAAIGFAGMVVLIRPDGNGSGSNDPLGVYALIATALCYGFSPGLTRRMLKSQHPMVQSASVSLVADATLWSITPFVEGVNLPMLPATWVAVLWLGVFSSASANLMYFLLLKAWGSSRSSLISYAIPIVGVATGVLLLGESITTNMLIGGALVFASLAVSSMAPARTPGS